MKNWIKTHSTGYTILILFALSSSIYVMMLTVTIPKVVELSGGMKILDMLPTGYSPEYVNSLMSNLGPEGRHAYLFYQLPLDMVYPALFGLSNCLIIAYFLRKLNRLEGRFISLCYLPLLAGIFDYCENLGIISILKTFPQNPETLSQITNVFSISKSLLTTISLSTIIILLLIWGFRKFFLKTGTVVK